MGECIDTTFISEMQYDFVQLLPTQALKTQFFGMTLDGIMEWSLVR